VNYKRILFSLGLFFTVCMCSGQDAVDVLKGNPLFETPSCSSKIVGLIQESGTVKVRQKTSFVNINVALYKKYDFFRIDIGGRSYWVCPDIIRSVDNNSFKDKVYEWPRDLAVGLGIFGLGIFLFLFLRLKSGNRREFFYRYQTFFLLGFLLLFHYVYLFGVIFNASGCYHYPLDEMAHFQIAKSIMTGDFNSPYQYTVGYPIFMIPFILLTGAKSVYDIAPLLSYLSACVYMPLIICIFFYIIKNLSGSAWKAFLSLLLYMVMTKCFFVVELANSPLELFSPFGLNHGNYIFTCYSFTLLGFFAMSCGFAFFLAMVIIFLCLYLRPGFWSYCLISGLFGFCCLVRMNYLVIAPLIACLFWYKNRDMLSDFRYLAKITGLCILVFLMVFSAQLIINFIQQGTIFTSPYHFHGKEVDGARGIKYFVGMAEYYFRIHNLWYALSIPAFFLIERRELRNFLILLALPLTLFYFCINFLGHPYRFLVITFPAMAAAWVCAGVWNRQNLWRQKAFLIMVLIALALPVLPFEWDFFQKHNITAPVTHYWVMLRHYLAFPLWLAALFYFRRNWNLLIFTLFFGVLTYERSMWIMVSGMVGACLYAFYDLITDYICAVRRRSVDGHKS